MLDKATCKADEDAMVGDAKDAVLSTDEDCLNAIASSVHDQKLVCFFISGISWETCTKKLMMRISK